MENLAARFTFTFIFIGTLVYFNSKNGGKRVDVLDKGTCLVDQTFELTASLNQYFMQNLVARDWVIMFNSWCFDLTTCALLFLFKFDRIPSTSFFLALIISAVTKSLTQQYLLTLERSAGFNYFYPGFYSLIVPYHDIQDFFYSGHMSTSAILIYHLHGLVKHHRSINVFYWLMWLWQTFKLAYIAIYMNALRTHYLIDFTSGFCMGIICSIFAEKLSFYLDVELCGRPAHRREFLYYQPCPRCGWANEKALDLIDINEKHVQALVFEQETYHLHMTVRKEI